MLVAIGKLRFLRCSSVALCWFVQQQQIVGLPFKIKQREASIELTSGFFDLKVKQEDTRANKFSNNKVRAQFIPFYGGKAMGVCSQFIGQYGMETQESYVSYQRNSSTGKHDAVTKTCTNTNWYPIQGTLDKFDYIYSDPALPKLQLYAGYKYPRKTIEEALCGTQVKNLKLFTKEDLVFEGQQKEVVWHEMKEKIAKERLRERIKDYEMSRAEKLIRSIHPAASSVRVDKVIPHLDIKHIELDRFMYPAYTCKYSKDPPLYRFVNGYTGKLTGGYMLSSNKIGIVCGMLCSGLALLAAAHPAEILWSGILGMAAGRGGGVYYNSKAIWEVNPMDLEKKLDGEEVIEPVELPILSELKRTDQNRTNKVTPQVNSTSSKGSNETGRVQKQRREPEKVSKNEHHETVSRETHQQPKATLDRGMKSSAIEDQNDPANIILQDEYCKLLNLRMGKKYTFLSFNEAYERAIKKWTPPLYTGNQAIATSMIKQLNSVYEYTLKRAGRR